MKEELRSALFSRWALLIMLLTFFSLSLPHWLNSLSDLPEYHMSALQLAISPIYFGGAILIFPFCARTTSAPPATRCAGCAMAS